MIRRKRILLYFYPIDISENGTLIFCTTINGQVECLLISADMCHAMSES